MITGAASGIGEGTARRFVAEGAAVVVADLQAEAGEALAAELGASARFARTDVRVESEVAAAVDLAVASWGRLDVMFNNAGIVGVVGPIAETPAEGWRHTLAILLDGVFHGMKHAARVMVPQGSGVILSTSSTAGVVGGLGSHAYTAAKHGVIGLTKSVASEVAPHGVRVNAIAPGSTVTAMTADVITGDPADTEATARHIADGASLGFAATPDDIANAALYLASDEARFVTGHTLVVDSGQTTAGQSSRFHRAEPTVYGEAGTRR